MWEKSNLIENQFFKNLISFNMTSTLFKAGALPDVDIQQLIVERFITNALPQNVGPSSLDLTADITTIQMVPSKFLPSKNKSTIERTLEHLGAKSCYTKGGTIIKPGFVYVARVVERINLTQTKGVFAHVNPKSSTGRCDIHVQLLADHTPSYDTLVPNWSGNLYVMFSTKSFPVLFQEDTVSLNQIRFFQDKFDRVVGDELRVLVASGILKNTHRETILRFSNVIRRDSAVELSLDLRGANGVLGWKAKRQITQHMIWEKGANRAEDFFEPIQAVTDDKSMIFEKDRFYILSSREALMVPKEYACEMLPAVDVLGEFRAHYAGFIDNGWGTGPGGHRPITLELRSSEDMYMYHGQPVGHIIFEKMSRPIVKSYDEGASNYSSQSTAKLGKFFI